MNNSILKDSPFGYKSAKELFFNIVNKKFENLIDADLEKYYDYIFSAGALRDWILNENCAQRKELTNFFLNDKFFSIFHSIYNNSKHYTLKNNNQKYYVKLDGKAIGETDENGTVYIKNDTLIFAEGYLVDTILGESGNSNLFCSITDGTNTENIYLYEICKQVNDKYVELLSKLV